MNARRAHTKSRSGCSACKNRKVKCDETIPCSRCVKRGDRCSLAEPASSSASTASGAGTPFEASPSDGYSFTLTDIQLFHRFTTVTCRYLVNPANESPWLDQLPALGTKHPFLMHEMMAVAAIDISTNAVDAQDATTNYLELARQHHAQALTGLMLAIAAHSADLATPIWACNSLFVPYYFATTADVGSLLFTSDPPGPAEWMLPLRGAVTIFRQYRDVLSSGPVGMHLAPYQNRVMIDGFTPPESSPSEDHIAPVIEQLKLHGAMDSAGTATMAKVFRVLRQSFEISDRGDPLSMKTASLTFCAAVPEEFFEMLGRKERAPLVIMAFWCVLLRRGEGGNWWLKFRKVRDILDFIVELLGPEASDLISWPLEVLRPDGE